MASLPSSDLRHVKALRGLEDALQCQRSGRIDEAERHFERVLKKNPNYFDALHLYGVFNFQLGKLQKSADLLRKAIRTYPRSVNALNNLGIVLGTLKRSREALENFDRALALDPNNVQTLNNRGIVLADLDRLDDALASFGRAIALQPSHCDAYLNCGRVLSQCGRYAEALAQYDKALPFASSRPDLFNHRGSVLQKCVRMEEALASYDKALALQPRFPEALYNRGTVLHELARYEEAIASYDRALAFHPDFADAFSNRGLTQQAMKRYEEARASYDKALAIQPDHVGALNNRGITLHALARPEEALADYNKTLAVQPDHVEALTNRGLVLHDLRRFDEANLSYAQALALRPNYAQARFNAAAQYLLLGDFARGWKEYGWRWETEQQRVSRRDFPQPIWTGGEPIESKTILLHHEQGYGDTIQFCRYVPLVAERGARVVLEVASAQIDLMRTLAGVSEIVAKGTMLPDFDLHCPLGTLPSAFETRLETIPAKVPYLGAQAEDMDKWGRRLGPRTRLRVGINWAGSAAFVGDTTRSIGLSRLLPVTSVDGVQFFSLQKDLRPDDAGTLQNSPGIIQLGGEMATFADAAAIVSMMDLVISSDTAVVHLAGAMGKPVWVLLQFVPDWRWLLDRDDSPWYPTMRLFRQTRPGDWGTVVEIARSELHGLASQQD
jgi:tetratricopeptide (TPR) repeat protein